MKTIENLLKILALFLYPLFMLVAFIGLIVGMEKNLVIIMYLLAIIMKLDRINDE